MLCCVSAIRFWSVLVALLYHVGLLYGAHDLQKEASIYVYYLGFEWSNTFASLRVSFSKHFTARIFFISLYILLAIVVQAQKGCGTSTLPNQYRYLWDYDLARHSTRRLSKFQ